MRIQTAVSIICLIGVALYFVYSIVNFSLSQPDTCFLLAFGRWLIEHGKLPEIDPFSHTMGSYENYARGTAFYQWLSEIIFFALFKWCGLNMLLTVLVLIYFYAFFAVPARIFKYLGVDKNTSLILSLFAVGSSSLRMYVRPEIFSDLFLAIFIQISILERTKRKSINEIDWRAVCVFGLLMVLWVNLHSGFTLGLFAMLVFLVADVFTAVRKREKFFANTYVISFLVCLFCSLINPYGAFLVIDLPKLYFNPINCFIDEFQPLSLLYYEPASIWSFFALALLFCLTVLLSLFQRRKIYYEYILFAAFSIAVSLYINRMVAFSVIVVITTFAVLLQKKRIVQNHHFDWRNWTSLAGCAGLIAVLTIFAARVNKLTIPSETNLYNPPFAAMEYMNRHSVEGNLFNIAEDGDLIMWSIEKPPKVFMDTRFSTYPPNVVKDYLDILLGKGAWYGLLQKYQVSTVLLPNREVLSQKLLHEKSWHILYSDNLRTLFTLNNKSNLSKLRL